MALDLSGLLHLFECIGSDIAVVTDLFDFQHAPVGRKSDLAELGQVCQTTADTKVVGVIDRDFRSERPSFFVVLFEVRVFVVDVQRRDDSFINDARPTSAGSDSGLLKLAPEDQLYLFRSAQIDILADDFFEETTAFGSAIPDLR